MVAHRLTGAVLFLSLFVEALPAQTTEALVRDASAKAQRGELETAVELLDTAVEQAPENVEARRWRGHCLNALGRHAKALADYDVAIRIDPSYAWTWYARGMAKHNLGRYAPAIADYSRAFELDPKNHKAVEWRGFTRSLLGDHLGAYLDLTQAMPLDPENPWVLFARAKAAAGLCDLDRARADLRTVVRLDPKSAEAHAQLGFLAAAIGEREAAITSFARALALSPEGHEYVRLWRYWLVAANGAVPAEVREALPKTGWPGDLAKALLGAIDASKLLERVAVDTQHAKAIETRRGEASFYIGLHSLLRGEREAAREHFKETLARGDSTMPEWHAARRLAR